MNCGRLELKWLVSMRPHRFEDRTASYPKWQSRSGVGDLLPSDLPQPVEADIRPLDGNSRFDPTRTQATQNIALRSRPLPPGLGPSQRRHRCDTLCCPWRGSSVVGGLHERVPTRHVDCVGGMATR